MTDRFDVSRDRRFKPLKNKEVKTVVDSRFAPLFEDARFTKAGKQDIYGRGVRQKTVDDDPMNMLILEKENEFQPKKLMKPTESTSSEGTEESEGEFHWDASSTSDEEDDISSAEEELEALTEKLAHELWEPLPLEHGDATRRVAIMGCDWENVKAVDLLALAHSVLGGSIGAESRPSDLVPSVRVYPSDFGKERIEYELKHGPRLEVLKAVEALREKQRRKGPIDESDKELPPEIALAIRKYEKERSMYYYAVVECVSVSKADELYSQLDGVDVDFAASALDVRFIPDSLTEFPTLPRDEATVIPAKYSAPETFQSVLKHSSAKLRWDEGDLKREKALRRRFTYHEMINLDLDQYIASESEENSDGDIAEQRKLLLGDLAGVVPNEAGEEEAGPVSDAASESDDDFFVSAEQERSGTVVHPPKPNKKAGKKGKKGFPLVDLSREAKEGTGAQLVAGHHALLEDSSSDEEGTAGRKRKRRTMKGAKAKKPKGGEDLMEVTDVVALDERFAVLKKDARFKIDGTHPSVLKKGKAGGSSKRRKK